ncbi:MAG: VanW family protein [Acidimicrobiia bacterium]|nr:VanW family protein [Acidimicrobiia bacterium]MDH4306109.1 VanW family protein [Acidimicrobiia bacterium]MDH5292571.1 VanW family protein [Acidimicrobiia bacterium]
MTKSPFRLLLIALSGLALLVVGAFGLSRLFAGDTVLGDVTALGVQVGGLSPDELTSTLETAAAELQAREAVFSIRGATTPLLPEQVELEFNVAAMAAEALRIGREGGLSSQFRWWIGHFGDAEIIRTVATVDEDAVEDVLMLWDEDFVGNPPFPGGIRFSGTNPEPDYPRDGEQIDRSVAPSLMLDALTAVSGEVVELPVASIEARLTDFDVDQAVANARLWLSAPVVLRSEDGEKSITFSPDQLASALTTTPTADRLELGFDPAAIEQILDAARDELEQPPVDARFETDGYDVSVVPGFSGTIIDPEATATELALAAGSAGRTGVLPFIEGAAPETTTADLEALGIEHLVSQFTTYHDCCQNRVTNIHLMADAMDGAIVAPGGTLSLNEYVGPRTEAKGYLEDGTIVAGELTKTIGGGVSQFATTFYNAVFWGGYEDVTHKPHSFYFPRYPEGIEATISWPAPELIFKNNTDAGVLVKTSYTDTSITVRFYGDNDGRAVALAYPVGGPLQREVINEGGAQARVVSASVGDRFDFREPGEPEYRANPDLAVDRQVTLQSSGAGWSVRITRTVTIGGNDDVQEWVAVYSPRRQIIEVHPCMVPDTSVECPEPSTTTTAVPPSTTGTTPTTDPPPTTTPTTAGG